MHLLRSCCWFFGSRTHRKRNLRSFDTWAECSAHIAHGCACAFVLRWDFFFCVHELQRHTRTQSRVIVHFSLFVVCLYSSVQLFCIIITFVFACCWCCSCCIVFITFSWRFATFASTFISSHFISFHVCPFIYILLSFASHSVACLAVFVAEYPHRFEWAWQPFVYVYGIGSMKFPIVWNFDHLAREFCSCTSTFRILHRCNTLLSPCIACLANVDSDKRILLL